MQANNEWDLFSCVDTYESGEEDTTFGDLPLLDTFGGDAFGDVPVEKQFSVAPPALLPADDLLLSLEPQHGFPPALQETPVTLHDSIAPVLEHPPPLTPIPRAQAKSQFVEPTATKRKRSNTSTKGSKKKTSPESTDVKKQQRLLRNRASAQLSRERKKAYLTKLEQRLAALEEANSTLEKTVRSLSNENQNLHKRLKTSTQPSAQPSAQLTTHTNTSPSYTTGSQPSQPSDSSPPYQTNTPANVDSSGMNRCPSIGMNMQHDNYSRISSLDMVPDGSPGFSSPPCSPSSTDYDSFDSSPLSTPSPPYSPFSYSSPRKAGILLFALALSFTCCFRLAGLDLASTRSPDIKTRIPRPIMGSMDGLGDMNVLAVDELNGGGDGYHSVQHGHGGRILMASSEKQLALIGSLDKEPTDLDLQPLEPESPDSKRKLFQFLEHHLLPSAKSTKHADALALDVYRPQTPAISEGAKDALLLFQQALQNASLTAQLDTSYLLCPNAIHILPQRQHTEAADELRGKGKKSMARRLLHAQGQQARSQQEHNDPRRLLLWVPSASFHANATDVDGVTEVECQITGIRPLD